MISPLQGIEGIRVAGQIYIQKDFRCLAAGKAAVRIEMHGFHVEGHFGSVHITHLFYL